MCGRESRRIRAGIPAKSAWSVASYVTVVPVSMFDPEDLDPTTASYHEAGHVLMAHLLGGRVVGASIERIDGAT